MVTHKERGLGWDSLHDSSSQAKQPGDTLYFIYANNPSHSCIEATLPLQGESGLYCIVHGGIHIQIWNTGTAVRWSLIHWYLPLFLGYKYLSFVFLFLFCLLSFYPVIIPIFWMIHYKICLFVYYCLLISYSFVLSTQGMLGQMIYLYSL